MPVAHRLTAKTIILLVLMVCFGSAGDTLLGKGMREVGPPSMWDAGAVARFLAGAVRDPFVWLGFSSLLLFFLCYMLLLTWADFSFVLPASAASYAVVPLLGHFLLREEVSALRWTGIALIALGVALVGSSPHSTTARAGATVGAASPDAAQGD